MKEYFIPFNNGGGTIVDWDFTNPIHCLTWYMGNDGYTRATLRQPDIKIIKLHRMIMNFPEEIHHKNENKLDNRLNNMISCTKGEHTIIHNGDHSIDTKKKMSIKRKGKYPYVKYMRKGYKNRPFQLLMTFNSNRKSLGYYEDPITASIVRCLVEEFISR